MKKLIFSLFITVLFVSAACEQDEDLYDYWNRALTIGATDKLEVTVIPENYTSVTITWSSSDSKVVSVTSDGIITAHTFTDSKKGTGNAVITALVENGASDFDVLTETFNITTTMSGSVNMLDLPPMKTDFNNIFMIGNVMNPGDISGSAISNSRLTRHYNVLTAENDMKPDKINPSRGSYNFSTADRMVNAAINSGFKVVGHTLLWHSQIPSWQAALRTDNTSKDTALQYMKDYITRVVTHYKGRVYSWDVLNEVFPDGGYTDDWKTSMRGGPGGNPWYVKIGSDFVYEGFLAARLADPDALLYYNDYNLNFANKAQMVHDMVRDVNARYKAAYPADPRPLIDGIGMQGHHNTGITAASIAASLDLFRPLGVLISISELDVLSQTWGEYSSNAALTNEGKLKAANLYGEYFNVFLDNADIIERITFWGIYDEHSWRARAKPLIFEGAGTSMAKPAYYMMKRSLIESMN